MIWLVLFPSLAGFLCWWDPMNQAERVRCPRCRRRSRPGDFDLADHDARRHGVG